MKKVSTLFLGIFACALALSACTTSGSTSVPNSDNTSQTNSINEETYTITFDTDGGSQIDSQQLKYGSLVKKPADPTKEGFIFLYWADKDGDRWNFNRFIVIGSETIKAVYEPVSSEPSNDSSQPSGGNNSGSTQPSGGDSSGSSNNPEPSGSNQPVEQYVTITFNTDEGTSIPSQRVKLGALVEKPSTDPVKEGYTFVHWIGEDGEEWNFSRFGAFKDETITAIYKISASQQEFDIDWTHNEKYHWHQEVNGETIADKGLHVFGDWVTDVEPTSTTTGHKYRDCEVCKYREEKELGKTDHVHNPGQPSREKEVLPTCTKKGTYEVATYCTICNEEITRNYMDVPALGHDYADPVIEWSSDLRSCTATRTCKHDSTHVETETVTDVAVEVIKYPTVELEGTTRYKAVFKNGAFGTQIHDDPINKEHGVYTIKVGDMEQSVVMVDNTANLPNNSAYIKEYILSGVDLTRGDVVDLRLNDEPLEAKVSGPYYLGYNVYGPTNNIAMVFNDDLTEVRPAIINTCTNVDIKLDVTEDGNYELNVGGYKQYPNGYDRSAFQGMYLFKKSNGLNGCVLFDLRDGDMWHAGTQKYLEAGDIIKVFCFGYFEPDDCRYSGHWNYCTRYVSVDGWGDYWHEITYSGLYGVEYDDRIRIHNTDDWVERFKIYTSSQQIVINDQVIPLEDCEKDGFTISYDVHLKEGDTIGLYYPDNDTYLRITDEDYVFGVDSWCVNNRWVSELSKLVASINTPGDYRIYSTGRESLGVDLLDTEYRVYVNGEEKATTMGQPDQHNIYFDYELKVGDEIYFEGVDSGTKFGYSHIGDDVGNICARTLSEGEDNVIIVNQDHHYYFRVYWQNPTGKIIRVRYEEEWNLFVNDVIVSTIKSKDEEHEIVFEGIELEVGDKFYVQNKSLTKTMKFEQFPGLSFNADDENFIKGEGDTIQAIVAGTYDISVDIWATARGIIPTSENTEMVEVGILKMPVDYSAWTNLYDSDHPNYQWDKIFLLAVGGAAGDGTWISLNWADGYHERPYFIINTDCEHYTVYKTHPETTVPNFDETENVAGRIYNYTGTHEVSDYNRLVWAKGEEAGASFSFTYEGDYKQYQPYPVTTWQLVVNDEVRATFVSHEQMTSVTFEGVELQAGDIVVIVDTRTSKSYGFSQLPICEMNCAEECFEESAMNKLRTLENGTYTFTINFLYDYRSLRVTDDTVAQFTTQEQQFTFNGSNELRVDDRRIFAYVMGGEAGEGTWAYVNMDDPNHSYPYVIVNSDFTSILFVTCPAGTTLPSYEVTGDNLGRIYRQTGSINAPSWYTVRAIDKAAWSDYSPYDPADWNLVVNNEVVQTIHTSGNVHVVNYDPIRLHEDDVVYIEEVDGDNRFFGYNKITKGYTILPNPSEGTDDKLVITQEGEYYFTFDFLLSSNAITFYYEDSESNGVLNGNFESGNLEGWKILSGTAFSDNGVLTTSTKYWSNPARIIYGMDTYYVDGFFGTESDAAKGTMRSSTFTLGGDGYISFMIGSCQGDCYIALCDAETGEELRVYTNPSFNNPNIPCTLRRVFDDVHEYIGRKLYLKVVDNATISFGVVNLDDVHVSLTITEAQQLATDTIEMVRAAEDDGYKTYLEQYYYYYSYPFEYDVDSIFSL